MSVLNLLSALARRWVVVLIGLALTAVGCWQVLQTVGTEHQASSQVVLLLPPEASGIATPTNPFLNMQTGQVTLASMLAGTVSSADVNRTLVGKGEDAEYDVAVVPGAGPILQVTTTSTDPEMAIATRAAVMKEIDTQLARLQKQANVPPRQLISGQRVGADTPAEVLGGSRIRALGATAAAGLLATLLLALGLDRLLASRRGTVLAGARAGRAGARAEGDTDGTEPDEAAGTGDDTGEETGTGVPSTKPRRAAKPAPAAPARLGTAAHARNGGDQRSRRVG